MFMSDFEIRRDYRWAKDCAKVEQIRILAELNLCSQMEIVDVLKRGGETVDIQKPARKPAERHRRYPSKPELARRLALYRQGLTDREIAGKLGCRREAVCMWRRYYNLPSNFK